MTSELGNEMATTIGPNVSTSIGSTIGEPTLPRLTTLPPPQTVAYVSTVGSAIPTVASRPQAEAVRQSIVSYSNPTLHIVVSLQL